MENQPIAMECLRDLVAFHTERIRGYQVLLRRLTPMDQHLATLFNAFVRQSYQLKDELLEMAAILGMNERELVADGRFGLAWSVVKIVFSSSIPAYPLDKCRSGENALLIAYHSVEGTEGLPAPIRVMVNRQKREVIAAREWIAHFEGLNGQPSQPSMPLS